MTLNLFYFFKFHFIFPIFDFLLMYMSRGPFYSPFSHEIKRDQRKPYYIYYFITCITFEFVTFITRYATFFWTEISKNYSTTTDGKWLKLFTSYFLLETKRQWPQIVSCFERNNILTLDTFPCPLNGFPHVLEIIINTAMRQRRTHFILINDIPS